MSDENETGSVRSIVERTYDFIIQTLQTDLPLWRYIISHQLSCWLLFLWLLWEPTAATPVYVFFWYFKCRIRNSHLYMVESWYFECKIRISCIPGTLKSLVLSTKGSDMICTYTRGYNYGLHLLHALQYQKPFYTYNVPEVAAYLLQYRKLQYTEVAAYLLQYRKLQYTAAYTLVNR
jgi:hypothetical protein